MLARLCAALPQIERANAIRESQKQTIAAIQAQSDPKKDAATEAQAKRLAAISQRHTDQVMRCAKVLAQMADCRPQLAQAELAYKGELIDTERKEAHWSDQITVLRGAVERTLKR